MTHSISAALMWAVYAQNFWVKTLLTDLGNGSLWHHFHARSHSSDLYVMGVILGMLLMSELGGITSCWMLGPVSLKTQHQKWDTWKWLTQMSPEFRHFNLTTMLTGSKQDMSWIGLCLLHMAECLRAVIAERSDKQIKQRVTYALWWWADGDWTHWLTDPSYIRQSYIYATVISCLDKASPQQRRGRWSYISEHTASCKIWPCSLANYASAK